MTDDRKDYTGSIVVGDIESASIMLPVDIQGQYTDLNIIIKAQTSNVDIQFVAQNVGIYLQGDWAPSAGTDIDLFGSCFNQNVPTTLINRTVPTGKTEYYTDFCGSLINNNPTNAAALQQLYISVDGDIKDVAYTSGAWLAAQPSRHYRKPIKAAAGQQVQVVVDPTLNGNNFVSAGACLRGWQV